MTIPSNSRLTGKLYHSPADRIMRAVCEAYRIKLSDLRGPQTKRHFARPRQVCMYLMRKSAGLTLSQTGRLLNRDHTTVLHGVRQISGLMQVDRGLRFTVTMICAAEMLHMDP